MTILVELKVSLVGEADSTIELPVKYMIFFSHEGEGEQTMKNYLKPNPNHDLTGTNSPVIVQPVLHAIVQQLPKPVHIWAILTFSVGTIGVAIKALDFWLNHLA